jgi:hypothetical protein
MSPPLEVFEPGTAESLATEAAPGCSENTSLPQRIARYSMAKKRALEMCQYSAKEGLKKESQRLSECGEYLVFRSYYTVNKIRLHAARFCKQHLICPLCAIRRGAKALKSYLDRYQVIMNAEGDLKPYLVTFTVKNGPDLLERFQHLRRNLQRLHKCRTRGRNESEVEKASAGVWSYELTNNGEGWHPHVHCIWLSKEAPDQKKLSDQWLKLTGDSFIVDVRPITGDHVQGFLEVFKYAVKFSGLSLADNLHAYRSLKGERMLATFGGFRGVEVPESLLDDPISLDDLPFIELFFRYQPGTGYVPTGT